jgi:uncharacterized coiled-coil protein SlyX
MKMITNITSPAIAAFALTCFALSPGARAVSPPPDGGYPGNNTAEGDSALLGLTSGTDNTAVGSSALQSDTVGSFNTATGALGLLSNTAGVRNTVDGYAALYSNTSGSDNTATGVRALFSNTNGGGNTANGASALQGNTTGDYDTAIGWSALFSNTTGGDNTATGVQALFHNTTGGYNTANGENALYRNTHGSENTATGVQALQRNTIGAYNTAIGISALGSNNTGSYNMGLGAFAGFNVTTATNVIAIGADGNNVSNSCYIGNIFGATSSNGAAVFVNSNGRLGTIVSSRRFKKKIRPAGKASEGLYALQPVTFHYKSGIDPEGTAAPQFGLVAEDVEKVNPELVVRDKEGKPYSVRYDQVNAMLLNEFLREHKAFLQECEKVEKLKATVTQQQKGMEALSVHLKEQDSKIQKVSDQIEINTFATERSRSGGAGPRVVRTDAGNIESKKSSQ